MPIGTSDGEFYQDEWDYALSQTSNKMPLGATEKPTGEGNSQEGRELLTLLYSSVLVEWTLLVKKN